MSERRSATLERPAEATLETPAPAAPAARQLPLLAEAASRVEGGDGCYEGIAPGWLGAKPGSSLGGRRPDRPDRLALEIGAAITARREERRLSQAELAQALGCGRSTVSRWEMGLRLPSLPHLVEIGRALGCGARALLPE